MRTMVQIVYRQAYGTPQLATHYVEAESATDAYRQIVTDYTGVTIIDAYITQNPNNFRKVA